MQIWRGAMNLHFSPYSHFKMEATKEKYEVLLAYDDWGRVISEFIQGRSWGEGDKYDSFEEEYNRYAREVGSCRNNFGPH